MCPPKCFTRFQFMFFFLFNSGEPFTIQQGFQQGFPSIRVQNPKDRQPSYLNSRLSALCFGGVPKCGEEIDGELVMELLGMLNCMVCSKFLVKLPAFENGKINLDISESISSSLTP